MFNDTDTPSNDLGKIRILADTGNNKIIAKQLDPYGFWYLNYERGQLPEHMQGAFTTIEYAKTAVQVYLNEKNIKAKAKEIA